MQEQLFQAMILGLGGFTLIGVVQLSVKIARLQVMLEQHDENTKEFRIRTQEETRQIRLELKELWDELRKV